MAHSEEEVWNQIKKMNHQINVKNFLSTGLYGSWRRKNLRRNSNLGQKFAQKTQFVRRQMNFFS